jgi:hypothetical protein
LRVHSYYICPVPACKWSGSSRSRHAKSRQKCSAQPVAIRYQPGTDVGGLVRMALSDPKVLASASMEMAEKAEQGPVAPPKAAATRIPPKDPPAARARPAGPPMEPPTKPPTRTGAAPPPPASAKEVSTGGGARAVAGGAEGLPDMLPKGKRARTGEGDAAAAAVEVAAAAVESSAAG